VSTSLASQQTKSIPGNSGISDLIMGSPKDLIKSAITFSFDSVEPETESA